MSASNKTNNRFPLKYIVIIMAAAWLVASFMLHLPPASWIQGSADQAPGAIEAETPNSPFPNRPPFRFGSRALSWVCMEYGLDTDHTVRELAGFAIKAKPGWSIKYIAEENDMETAALFEVIRELSLNR